MFCLNSVKQGKLGYQPAKVLSIAVVGRFDCQHLLLRSIGHRVSTNRILYSGGVSTQSLMFNFVAVFQATLIRLNLKNYTLCYKATQHYTENTVPINQLFGTLD